MATVIAAIVAAILGWLFSGEKKTVVRRSAPGLEGLDRESLSK